MRKLLQVLLLYGVTLSLAAPALATPQYEAIILDQDGFTWSEAYDVSGSQIAGCGGNVFYGTPDDQHALLWNDPFQAPVNLHPSGFISSIIEGTSGGNRWDTVNRRRLRSSTLCCGRVPRRVTLICTRADIITVGAKTYQMAGRSDMAGRHLTHMWDRVASITTPCSGRELLKASLICTRPDMGDHLRSLFLVPSRWVLASPWVVVSMLCCGKAPRRASSISTRH